MTPELFKQYWEKTFPGCPPVGYFLRETFPDIWFRIHTLPLDKRYADTPQEMEEILRRHNEILSDLLVENEKYVLITTGASAAMEPAGSYPQLDKLLPEKQFIFSIAKNEYEGDPEPYYWHFFMTEMVWNKNSADELLKQVAEENLDYILFVRTEQDSVYCPYDGGGDIFVKDDLRRNSLKSKYSEWLPNDLKSTAESG